MWYKSETQSVGVILALIVNEAMNCTCHYVHTLRRVTFDTGGRLYLIGIYLGMLLAVITTFFAINCYMHLSAKIAPDSPIYSWQLASSMSVIVYGSYELFVNTLSVLAWFLLYICV